MTEFAALFLGLIGIAGASFGACWWLASRGRATLAFRLAGLVGAVGFWLMWKATTIPGSGGWLHVVGFFICAEMAVSGLIGAGLGRRRAQRHGP